MSQERIIAEEAIRTPEQRARRKAELGSTSIRETVLGTARYLTPEQKRRVKAYRVGRVSAGKIFGARTEELLGTDGTIDERIRGYFEKVDKGFNDLGEIYGLQDRMHAGGDFAAIKEEATRLMWVYGIKTEILEHDQLGLLLLGGASTNLHLKGKGESYSRERKRIGHIIRMISQSIMFQDTSSVKVSKWLKDTQEKADNVEDPVTKDTYQKRADVEREHTTAGYISENYASLKNNVRDSMDAAATTVFNDRYRTMPHLVRVQQRLGLSEMPSIEWAVTGYSKEEFGKQFNGAVAFYMDPYICLPRETHTQEAINVQQHEMHHAVTKSSITFHLGSGMLEADAERITDIPNFYPHERMLGYYVDDVLDSKSQHTDADSAYIIRQQAAINTMQGMYGSEAERRWNAMLLDGFGLEGYLTYYLVGGNNHYHGLIKEQLLDVPIAAYRLSRYAVSYKGGNFTFLPDDIYKNKMDYEEILEKSVAILGNGNTKMRPDFFPDPTKNTMQYPPETLGKLAERANAKWQVDNTNSRVKSFGLKLEELAWMKQRYPDIFAAMDSEYSVPIDLLNEIPQQNVSFSEQEFGDVQRLINQVLDQMGASALFPGFEFDNTLKYIILRLSSRDYNREVDESLQLRVGQTLATAYRGFDAKMPGRPKDVAIEMRYTILDKIIKDGATFADFQALFDEHATVGV